MGPTPSSTGSMRLGNRPAAPSREGGTQAGLVVHYAPSYEGLPPAFPFGDPVISIGRDPASGIVLSGHAVSFQRPGALCDAPRSGCDAAHRTVPGRPLRALERLRLRHAPASRSERRHLPLSQTLLARAGKGHLRLSVEYLTGLLHYDYPFNVRELDGFLKTSAALCEGGEIGEDLLPTDIKRAMADYGREASREEASPMIAEGDLAVLLVEHKGNVTEVARAPGKGRATVYRWMQRYAMVVSDFR